MVGKLFGTALVESFLTSSIQPSPIGQNALQPQQEQGSSGTGTRQGSATICS